MRAFLLQRHSRESGNLCGARFRWDGGIEKLFLLTINLSATQFVINLHKVQIMKKSALILFLTFYFSLFTFQFVSAQCSICTKTAQQMGEKPAKALNAGIIYLAIAPLSIIGYIGYRWWKSGGQEG